MLFVGAVGAVRGRRDNAVGGLFDVESVTIDLLQRWRWHQRVRSFAQPTKQQQTQLCLLFSFPVNLTMTSAVTLQKGTSYELNAGDSIAISVNSTFENDTPGVVLIGADPNKIIEIMTAPKMGSTMTGALHRNQRTAFFAAAALCALTPAAVVPLRHGYT